MEINANLDETVFLESAGFEWIPSPLAGVDRVMLDRVGDEVAVATSIVRYAPGAHFDPHGHALGEEFIVLEGVFSDEHGDYHAGTYIRNPPGTSHTPSSEPGCVIWVKLRQFDDDDLTPHTSQIPEYDASGSGQKNVIYEYGSEEISWVHVPAGERFAFSSHFHTRELLLLSGEVTWQQAETYTLKPWSWIRIRPGQPLRINAVKDAVLFSKTRPEYRDPRA